MKFILPSIILFVLFSWCSQQSAQEQQINTGEQLFSSLPIESWQEQFLESELSSWTYLGWIYTPIFISGNILVVSWVFSTDIPKETAYKTYSSQYTPVNKSYYEWVWFTNQNKRKTFTIHISKIIRPETTYADKDLCLVEYYDGFVSKSEKTKIIQNQKIYVYYTTLMSSWPDVEPQKIIDTQFCLVRSGMLYTFSASNYTHEYIDHIIDSFKFY